MEIGAIAKILEHMAGLGKGKMADPIGPFAAHLGNGIGIAVHITSHEVTADAALPPAAFWYLCRGVVWAAGAEIGNARHPHFLALCGAARLGVQKGQARRDLITGMEMPDPAGQGAGYLLGPELAAAGQHFPAALVMAANHPWPAAIGQVIQRIPYLAFHKAAFFLDHHHFFQTVGELAHGIAIKWERHAHF